MKLTLAKQLQQWFNRETNNIIDPDGDLATINILFEYNTENREMKVIHKGKKDYYVSQGIAEHQDDITTRTLLIVELVNKIKQDNSDEAFWNKVERFIKEDKLKVLEFKNRKINKE